MVACTGILLCRSRVQQIVDRLHSRPPNTQRYSPKRPQRIIVAHNTQKKLQTFPSCLTFGRTKRKRYHTTLRGFFWRFPAGDRSADTRRWVPRKDEFAEISLSRLTKAAVGGEYGEVLGGFWYKFFFFLNEVLAAFCEPWDDFGHPFWLYSLPYSLVLGCSFVFCSVTWEPYCLEGSFDGPTPFKGPAAARSF